MVKKVTKSVSKNVPNGSNGTAASLLSLKGKGNNLVKKVKKIASKNVPNGSNGTEASLLLKTKTEPTERKVNGTTATVSKKTNKVKQETGDVPKNSVQNGTATPKVAVLKRKKKTSLSSDALHVKEESDAVPVKSKIKKKPVKSSIALDAKVESKAVSVKSMIKKKPVKSSIALDTKVESKAVPVKSKIKKTPAKSSSALDAKVESKAVPVKSKIKKKPVKSSIALDTKVESKAVPVKAKKKKTPAKSSSALDAKVESKAVPVESNKTKRSAESSDVPDVKEDAEAVPAKKLKADSTTIAAGTTIDQVPGIKIKTTKQEKHNAKMKERKEKAREKEHAEVLQYLDAWKNNREAWKFQKLRQNYIQTHIFDETKFDDKVFPIALEYLSGAKGMLKEKLQASAKAVIDVMDVSAKYNRARELMQSLG